MLCNKANAELYDVNSDLEMIDLNYEIKKFLKYKYNE